MQNVELKYQDKNTWWFAYECYNGDCSESVHQNGCGMVADFRFTDPSGTRSAPEAICPACHQPMVYRDRWKACSNGYGSDGSPCQGSAENHLEDQIEDQIEDQDEELDARDIAIIFAGRIKRIEGSPQTIMQVVNAIESAILQDREARNASR